MLSLPETVVETATEAVEDLEVVSAPLLALEVIIFPIPGKFTPFTWLEVSVSGSLPTPGVKIEIETETSLSSGVDEGEVVVSWMVSVLVGRSKADVLIVVGMGILSTGVTNK